MNPLNSTLASHICRRLGLSAMKSLRAFVNTWRTYEPIGGWTRRKPYGLKGKYWFTDRSKGSESLLVILAGYKESVWEEVFSRVEAFVPAHFDVCIATSGRHVPQLERLCEEKGWSYLRTKRNHVCLIQNIAIHLHQKAEWVYKVDEDMFLTKGFFDALKTIYIKANNELRLDIGFVSPLIQLNGYGHVRILEETGLVKAWEEKFGSLRFADGINNHTTIVRDPNAALFMWGAEQQKLGDIDALNDYFASLGPCYDICPIRFSIGAILFKRNTWKRWGMFPVVMGAGMGEDESHICRFCLMHGYAMIIARNTIVGHLCYGPQTNAMIEYYQRHLKNRLHWSG